MCIYIYLYTYKYAYKNIYIYMYITYIYIIFMYVCVCVCVCLHMYIYVQIYMYIYLYIHIHTHAHTTHTHTYMHTYTNTYTRAYINLAYIHAYLHISTCMYTGISIYTYMHIRQTKKNMRIFPDLGIVCTRHVSVTTKSKKKCQKYICDIFFKIWHNFGFFLDDGMHTAQHVNVTNIDMSIDICNLCNWERGRDVHG